jgi:molybdopterin synthase catalytic subunit
MRISVQQEDFDLSSVLREMRKDPKIGAIASFVGVVREVAMTLEHYPGMTEKALRKIVDEAKGRWQVLDCTVIHRFGPLQPTDQIVLVAVASPHRGDAFDACEFIMDYLKTQAPFWKKEDGKGWVEARASDDSAADRWKDPSR